MTGCIFVTLNFIIFCAVIASGKKESYKTVVKFEEFRECPKPGINRIQNITLAVVGRGKYVVNLIYNITKTIDGGKALLTIKKCSTSSVGDCEHFMNMAMDICAIHQEKGRPWSTFLESVHPHMTCPIKPGIYVQRNATLDAGELMRACTGPTKWITNYHWRMRFNVVKDSQSLNCAVMAFSYQNVKV